MWKDLTESMEISITKPNWHPGCHFLNQSEIKIQFVISLLNLMFQYQTALNVLKPTTLLEHMITFFQVNFGLKLGDRELFPNLLK